MISTASLAFTILRPASASPLGISASLRVMVSIFNSGLSLFWYSASASWKKECLVLPTWMIVIFIRYIC